jgi:hypothetical protein
MATIILLTIVEINIIISNTLPNIIVGYMTCTMTKNVYLRPSQIPVAAATIF